jgi:gluconate 2-dehydrogenase gamma chain
MPIDRREVLGSALIGLLASATPATAEVVTGKLPWKADAADPPTPVRPGPWQFFSAGEASLVEALVDGLIPPDAVTPGGRDAGCAVYMDRQLAGSYGRADGLYRAGPFVAGTPQQGDQSERTPAARFRDGLATLERECRAAHTGRTFVQLSDSEQDAVLVALDGGKSPFDAAESQAFFAQLLSLTKEGFFADPVYGGNRDMCAWKMIGFPGARYDYRDWVERHNERYPLPPVSIGGRVRGTRT